MNFCGNFSFMQAITDITYQFGGPYSKVVDVFNSATGTWSIDQISAARARLAAVTIGRVAIFAGGFHHRMFFLCCDLKRNTIF